jgi:hypothetical protein
MTRNILATATVLAVAAFASSGAQACISCEYVPEVVRSSSTLPHTGHYYSANAYNKKRAVRAAIVSRQQLKAAKIAKIEKSEPAKVAKITKSEPTVAKAEPIEKKVAKVAKADDKSVESENSSVSIASAADVAATVKSAVEETAKQVTAKPTDCKKFFASVGMTLTVPCE